MTIIITQQMHETHVVKHLEVQVFILRKISGKVGQAVIYALDYRFACNVVIFICIGYIYFWRSRSASAPEWS